MTASGSEVNGDKPTAPIQDEGNGLGISLSGGGIRSAAFSLGVCQRLIEEGTLERANYLSAVSGGSYIAAALAISHAEDSEGRWPPPWGRRSPEESRLRRNLAYLAPGLRGRFWLFANLLYGLILNLIPLVLGAYLSGRLAGILLGSAYPGLGDGESVTTLAAAVALGLCAALVLSSTVVVGFRRFFDKDRLRKRLTRRRSERSVVLLLGAAATIFAFGVALPAVVFLLGKVSDSAAIDVGWPGTGNVPHRPAVALGIVAISIALGSFAVWLLRRRRLRRLRGILAYLAGLGILLAPFVLAAQTGAANGFSPEDVRLFVIGGLVLLGFGILVHNRRYSMHLFYRERLQDAFALRRVENPATGEVEVEKIPYKERIRLSEIEERRVDRIAAGGPSFPKLVMCAAVAARGAEVPNKAWAASFTFEGDETRSDAARVSGKTRDLEGGDFLGGGDVTLPGMMAISGAAISPLMGRFTLPGFRFLMAMLNIRLGVWLRNPNLGAVSSNGGTQPGKPAKRRLRKALDAVGKGWREPGALYVLKEALGLANAKRDYVYVSDGGHWENLGLAELLQRRCTEVIVVDASGDPGLGDISRAMSVARAEAGVEFDFDPSCTIAGEDGLAESPVKAGSFRYHDGLEGHIYYIRCVLWKDAPSDLRLFAERERPFPNHPTSNQFLSGELFDAYRALGWSVGDFLVPELSLLPARFGHPVPSES